MQRDSVVDLERPTSDLLTFIHSRVLAKGRQGVLNTNNEH